MAGGLKEFDAHYDIRDVDGSALDWDWDYESMCFWAEAVDGRVYKLTPVVGNLEIDDSDVMEEDDE